MIFFTLLLVAGSPVYAWWFNTVDPDKPHEYIDTKGYSYQRRLVDSEYANTTYQTMKKFCYDELFPLKTGQCSKYLSNINESGVRSLMTTYNNNFAINDKMLYVVLECVEDYGMDQACINKYTALIGKVYDREELAGLVIAAANNCKIERRTGQKRVISLK